MVGKEKIHEILQAIIDQNVIEIEYQPFLKEKKSFILHPYYLKEYNNRWFLLGYNPNFNQELQTVAIDRIFNMSLKPQIKFITVNIDWMDYFSDLVGVSKPVDASPQLIKIIFSGKTAYYVLTKPMHESQKVRWINPDQLLVELNLIINYEFEQILMPFIDSIQIICPSELKTKLADRLIVASKQFHY